MQIPHVSTVLIWTISLASIVCMLLRPRRIAEAYWACGGGILLVLTRLIPLPQAAHAVYEGLDVYLFLTGMMILAELAREEGVFDWVADVAAHHAGNSPGRLFVLIYLVGTLVTALLSNDATAAVLTPAVLAVVRRAKVDPKPYLLACAFIANAASFVFPISNPANLIIFDEHLPPLGMWLRIFLLPSTASILLTFLCLRWVSRKELRGEIQGEVKRVSWSVLPLVAGLFIIVEALQNAGLLRLGLTGLRALAETTTWAAKGTAALVAALLSNGMNNLPVGLMSGAAIRHAQETRVVAHAILIGVDLGPHFLVAGSLGTILWLISLRREKVVITAWEFFKIGLIAMPVALIASLLFLWN